MKKFWTNGPLMVLAAVLVTGCSKEAAKTDQPSAQSSSTPGYLLSAEPEGAVGVAEVLKSVKDGDQVVVVGRIGGDTNPWDEEIAAFTIADTSLKACGEDCESGCETPWDYCCQTDKLPDATVWVEFVDEKGQRLKPDAKKLFDLKELQTVVVRGTAQRDEDGTLVILARAFFVRS